MQRFYLSRGDIRALSLFIEWLQTAKVLQSESGFKGNTDAVPAESICEILNMYNSSTVTAT